MNQSVAYLLSFAMPFAAALALSQTPKTEAPATANTENGKRLYVRYGCYQCHGYHARGGGPAPAGPRLAPRPIPFVAFSGYIRHPGGAMPPYTIKVVTDAELADIHAYLKTIPQPTPLKDIRLLDE